MQSSRPQALENSCPSAYCPQNQLCDGFQDPFGNYLCPIGIKQSLSINKKRLAHELDQYINVLSQFQSTSQDLQPKIYKELPIEDYICQKMEHDLQNDYMNINIPLQDDISQKKDSSNDIQDQMFQNITCNNCKLNSQSMLALASLQDQVFSSQQLIQQNYSFNEEKSYSLILNKNAKIHKKTKNHKKIKKSVNNRNKIKKTQVEELDQNYSSYQPQKSKSLKGKNNSKNRNKRVKRQKNVVTEQVCLKQISTKGCNCKKAKCCKKYCQCFSLGSICSSACKCCSCLNK